MNILGLIPARGGSKSIPHKNIIPLEGKPLLAYTCEAALKSRSLTRIVLSTDDSSIAEIGREYEVEVPFMRPNEMARDDTPSVVVAQHAIKWLYEEERWKTEILVLLQPTSPLRRAEHIDEALNLLIRTEAETVVSVVKVPHRYNPYAVMELADGYLVDFIRGSTWFNRYRRQDIPQFYARNGPAVLASYAQVIAESGTLFGSRMVPYFMEAWDSIDIDDPYDLEMAAWVLSRQRKYGVV